MVSKEIVVRGMVQGVGFRPFVAELAEKFNIAGWVRNVNGIVVIHATAEDAFLAVFSHTIKFSAPIGAKVDSIEIRDIGESGEWDDVVIPDDGKQFHIIESAERLSANYPLIPADLPTCPTCEAEMRDPNNRRYRHPFISCTSCGPRYSIIEALPYDRERITMKKFDMCPICKMEYGMKANRRRHAQTIACWDCGPVLWYEKYEKSKWNQIQTNETKRQEQSASYLEAAVNCIKQGGIVAVKDIGGFHLACSPFRKETVQNLRRMKGREKKPFAVMFRDLNEVRDYCLVNHREESLLLSEARPIVLLKKRTDEEVEIFLDQEVCKNSPDVGAMLPCNPIQIMLTDACGPLIMTSANRSGELILTETDDVRQMLGEYITNLPEEMQEAASKQIGILTHDRPILTSLDDSIQRVICTGQKPNLTYRVQTFRRARGFVPTPIDIPVQNHMLAIGGDLKSTFCYTGYGKAYLSQYLGDLEDESCFMQYQKQLERMKNLFGFVPKSIAYDRHPAYRSARSAEKIYQIATESGHNEDDFDYRNMKKIVIQHHKAHAASVIAEHNLTKDAICFAFDGTGYGDDGTIWGSEVFFWDAQKYEMTRIDHLPPVKLIGGDEGAKNAETILYGYLSTVNQPLVDREQIKDYLGANASRYELVEKALSANINAITSTSMGRMFDAVSALLGICTYNSYEGEAPIELENAAAKEEEWIAISPDPKNWIPELMAHKGANTGQLARGFIYAVADWIKACCDLHCRQKNQECLVVLSGGTFQNRILLERTLKLLEQDGYQVYINEKVPAGDGGLCLGQAFLAEERGNE
ncbi:MAG: carbamoyltransferase HypF [Lachnospiraceae bacterium]|nr:carbamoyltransferase HypF [Lachnospiraceae bacterium]